MTQNVIEQPKIVEAALERMAWGRGFTLQLIDAVPDDQLTYRPSGRGNHTLWVMGHLANTDDAILAVCRDQAKVLPERYNELFGGKDRPSGDASRYPSKDELLEAMHDRRQAMIDWINSWEPDQIYTPVPELLRPFSPDWVTTAYTLAAHDLFHAGQVASCRAGLGLDVIHA